MRLYCPTACRAGNDLYNDNAVVAYYYSHFEKILKEGKSLPRALAVVDEIHAFFKEPAQLAHNGTISTSYEFVKNTFKVIGMSATFGGEQVKRDFMRTFDDCSFI